MKSAYNIFIVAIASIAVVTHLLKIIYILFEPQALKRYRTFSNKQLSNTSLVLYYLLAISVFLGIIFNRSGVFMSD
jgi:hypothetical protein